MTGMLYFIVVDFSGYVCRFMGTLDCDDFDFQCRGKGVIDCTGGCPGGKIQKMSYIEKIMTRLCTLK